MKPSEARRLIQTILMQENFYHGKIDGDFGPKTFAALNALDVAQDEPEEDNEVHTVKATSFADPEDVKKFKQCIAQGHTENFCFKVGDNGIGKWGDDTTQPFPMCALPPEDWEPKWGSAAKGRKVLVRIPSTGAKVICALRDTMPHKKNIKNGAGIDLNPSACDLLGLKPPVRVTATWQWAE